MAATSTSAVAQLRVVSLNGYNDPTHPLPRSPWADTILGAIGSSVSDDQFIPGNSGIVKPIDVLALQEVDSIAVTVAGYRDVMNALYPGANYQYGTIGGASTGAGTQGLVYNANAVTLIATKKVGVSSGSGQPRQSMRYQLRPVGYGAAADLYIYNVHYKAGDEVSEPNAPFRRNVESQAIRADVTTVPAGANIMYTGDFNVYHDTETAFQTLIAPGDGQAIDPINKIGDWHNNTTYIKAHTQSPYNPSTATALGTGFTIGATGGMDDRFDYQLLTANLVDGNGVAYIPNSYHAFGNNGTHTVTSMNQPINSASNTAQPREVLDAMAGVLDHLPVVADYQLPAKLGVSISPATTPAQVIVGAAVTMNVTVSNTAPVSYAVGADALNYTLSASGAASGTVSGSDAALGGGNLHAVTLNTATTGNKTGAIGVSSTSEAVADNNFSASVNYAVLDHARPSFADASDQTATTIDFGYVPVGSSSAPRAQAFSVRNRVATAGFTAGLDLDSVTVTGDAARLTTTAAPFTNLAAGGGTTFSAGVSASVVGNFQATHTFATSDQDLAGAIARPNLALTSTARVFAVATFPVSGFIFLPASEPLTTGPFSITSGVTLTKTGPGAMTINGPQNNGAGSSLVINGGAVTFATNAGGKLGLTVNSGGSASFSATQDLRAIAVSGSGSVDVRNQKMIVRNGDLGAFDGTNYSGITGLIQRAYDYSAWDGPGGITTSESVARNGLTSLAIAPADAIGYAGGTFGGVSVNSGDILVMYTYAGDLNLDGFIDAGDYGIIDNYFQFPGTSGYANGDFNFDGIIDAADYGIIDNAFQLQGTPFPVSAATSAAVMPVPEPSALVLLAIAATVFPRRRTARTRRP